MNGVYAIIFPLMAVILAVFRVSSWIPIAFFGVGALYAIAYQIERLADKK